MGRKILAIVSAIVLATAIFLIIEMIATMFAPDTPKNLEYMSAADRAQYFGSMPMGAYLTVYLGYLLGSFAAGWMVTKVGQIREGIIWPLIVGGLLTIGGCLNFFVWLPGQPTWFVALSMLTYIPFSILGYFLAKGRS
jgi:hypothetical protein